MSLHLQIWFLSSVNAPEAKHSYQFILHDLSLISSYEFIQKCSLILAFILYLRDPNISMGQNLTLLSSGGVPISHSDIMWLKEWLEGWIEKLLVIV